MKDSRRGGLGRSEGETLKWKGTAQGRGDLIVSGEVGGTSEMRKEQGFRSKI